MARPREGWATVFAFVGKGATVDFHFIFGQAAQNRAGKDGFNKDVFGQHHFFARWRAEAFKHGAGVLAEFIPCHRFYDRFHIGDAFDAVAVPVGPVKAEC